ncbi:MULTISPECIES: MAPEG family protein [unclassified Rhizobium]|uniref:MAPEG family protein n=1 Tax=unclassified Rhizobium TaxID=2613769 RepID=UPI001AE6FE52|nr:MULTISPECIES: MAPEG family protein [unclassified Rhizobium]MBP2462573.1 putative MAPEG superfamily protein [Rhizobium sp. PvP014]MBP2529967.1 putative MAPEG superfamily protein [Rhizobium sp. PvP099]
MDAASANATYLLVLLCLSVVLLLVHILLQGNFATKDRGTAWNAGPRDGDNEPKSVMAGRTARASRNYQETYPAFVGLLLAMILTGDSSGFGLFGAAVWLVARIVYIPLYLKGIPYVRSLVWLVSLVGLALMMIALFV